MTEKRSISEPPEHRHLSESSAPSDIDDLRFMDPIRSPDLTSTRKSVDAGQQDKEFLTVPVFIDMRECPVAPTIWGLAPQHVTCPNCNKSDKTTVKHRPSSATLCCCWIFFLIGGLCLFSLCLCCQETSHYCSHCKKFLGRRSVL